MNKQNFLLSADAMNYASLKIYSLSQSILAHDMNDARALAAEDTAKNQEKENKKAKTEEREASVVEPSKAEDFLESETKSLMNESENIHSMVHKSCKAFFVANKQFKGGKETYSLPVFKDVAPVFVSRNHFSGDKDFLKSLIESQVSILNTELEKHVGPKVYHDNGSVWRKTATDAGRFGKIKDSLKSISESVS